MNKEEENINTKHHSDKIRQILEKRPPIAIRMGTWIILMIFIILAMLFYLCPDYLKDIL